MFFVTAKETDTIENLLRKYKSKYKQLSLIKTIRQRSRYEKPSMQRRKEVLKAIYRERYLAAQR